MIQTISTKLQNLLKTLAGKGKPFVSVLDYHTLENKGFPYMTFEFSSFNGTVLDTCNNERTRTFEALIFQEETETGGRKEATEILYKAVDEVVALLDKNYTLEDTVIVVSPTGGEIIPFITNTWKVLVCKMQIDIKTAEFIW